MKCLGCLRLLKNKQAQIVSPIKTTTPAIDPPMITPESVPLNLLEAVLVLLLIKVVTVFVEDEPSVFSIDCALAVVVGLLVA